MYILYLTKHTFMCDTSHFLQNNNLLAYKRQVLHRKYMYISNYTPFPELSQKCLSFIERFNY